MKAERAGFPLFNPTFRPDSKIFVVAPVLVITVYLVVLPLVFLVWMSFRSGQIGMPSELTLSNYARAYANPATYDLI